jgi:hypothetical protein
MELGPINGIISLPVMKVQPREPGLSAVVEIENSPRAGDETYSGGGNQSANGQDGQHTEAPEETGPESTPEPSDTASGSNINYFA